MSQYNNFIIIDLTLGDAADGMYFIENGKVSVRIIQDSGSETEISKLEKGQYFGELALVTHRPRAASVYSENAVKVACKCFIKLLFCSIRVKSNSCPCKHKINIIEYRIDGAVIRLWIFFPISIWIQPIKLNSKNNFHFLSTIIVACVLTVCDVEAFERLLGPCMDIMKRNIDDYESQLVKIFGSKSEVADIR